MGERVLAVGVMSGTSVDGVDLALIEIMGTGYDMTIASVCAQTLAYPPRLREQILAIGEGEALSALAFGQLHCQLGELFGVMIRDLISQVGYQAEDIAVIGCHGQTIAHQPPKCAERGYTVQLGDGAVIAQATGITTVNNFRARDMAWGGQGAPLVPLVDWLLCRSAHESRCIQNIGGIANVTYLPAGCRPEQVLAFDTGPGNMLVDRLVSRLSGGLQTYDPAGVQARQGQVHEPLLRELLQDSYFQMLPPKSTGREAYGLQYLEHWLSTYPQLDAEDLLATFTELTARSIAQSYQRFLPSLPERLLIGGGGVHNLYLRERLQALLPEVIIDSTAWLGLDPDYKEAICFAVLGYLRLTALPGNLPQVTQASRSLLLGDLHPV